MKIIIDAMGGDNAPRSNVEGAVMAAAEFGEDIVLVGRVEEILRAFEELGYKELPEHIEIMNATEIIGMEDDPATAVRRKKDSSMSVALRMLRDGQGDAVVSAGSTGALLSGATIVVRRIRGIRRAAMAPVIPGAGGGTLLIDCGANAECTPEYLLQFAYMGSFYARRVLGRAKPRVALLNIGAEESKGTALQKETYALLSAAHEAGRINFVGNIEARGLTSGEADVIVTDGFSGNIALKTLEGTALYLSSELKKMFKKNLVSKLAALMLSGGIKEFKSKLDYNEVGGTPLIGITKPVIKAHGSSNARAIRSAVLQAMDCCKANVAEEISANIEYMKLSADDKAEAES